MLYADRVGPRLAIGWTMGTVVSALGIYLSVKLDLPTGAAMVCTFGLVLVLMAAVRPLFRRAGRRRPEGPAPSARGRARGPSRGRRERAEPVAALVVLAGDGREARLAVRGGRGAQRRAGARSPAGSPRAMPSSIQARLRFRPSRCASLRIGRVGHDAGREPVARGRRAGGRAGTRRASARTRPAAARGASGRPRRGTARGSPRPTARRRAGRRGPAA